MRFRDETTSKRRVSDEEDANLVRGASLGFSILLVGGLAAPMAGRVPLVGQYWLTVMAVVAFLVAGLRSGGRLSHGVLSALGAYLLVLPIVWMTTHGWDVQQTLETAAVAVVVGGGASLIVGWARRAKSGRPARSAEEPARKGRGRASALSLGRKAA